MPTIINLFRHGRNKKSAAVAASPQTLSATLMSDNITASEPVITKWAADPGPLFSQAHSESADFCRAIDDLQRAMIFFSSPDCVEGPKTRSAFLVRAQTLMQTAMQRLEREFYRILSTNRDLLDPESSLSDPDTGTDTECEIRNSGDSIEEVERASKVAMADLRTIAETMVSAGYGKECVKTYNLLRKSIVDEGLYKLGFENLSLSQVQKLDWEVLDLKIRSWLAGSGIAMRTLMAGERILCDHVFQGSDPIRESCFAEITREAATRFLAFPELVARSKRSPEKLFRILDLYNSLSDLCVDIGSVFSFESTAVVQSQAMTTLLKLGEAARSTIDEFESAIQKDGSKAPIHGGGVHPLTRYVMNYLVFLADYEFPLADIFANFPIQTPPMMPESFFDSSAISSPSSSSSIDSAMSMRIAWLILVLLCKLDGKAEIYKDVALSYLFLANNLQYVVKKVKESRLTAILGYDWVFKHQAKVRHYASSYERHGWGRIAAAIPAAESPEAAAEKVRVFYAAFEEAVRVQREWIVADERMKEEIRELIAELIVPAYRGFYEAYRPILSGGLVSGDVAVVRYAPEDLLAQVKELFSGASGSDSGSRSGSGSGSQSGSGSGSGSNKSSWWSFTP